MEKECLKCGKAFKVKPSLFKSKHYCNKSCKSKKITAVCVVCGKEVVRTPATLSTNTCCGLKCFRKFASKRFTEMNIEINHTRMVPETRAKLREARLGTGEGKTYTKTYGRHTHRIVAEEKLGRPLKPGEVVHHIDGNKRNNHPDNLQILESQAEHAKIHIHEMLTKRKNKKAKQ